MRDLKPSTRVLDMTCGSGVFLVEALRRLVQLQANGRPITRQLIRKTMKDQIFGVDKNEAAIRVASFSLYLTALELDPNPGPPKALRFEPLIGRNLFVADALNLGKDTDARHLCEMRFDAIIGNPPWTYAGSEAKPTWPIGHEPTLPPRSQDFAFVWRSIELAHPRVLRVPADHAAVKRFGGLGVGRHHVVPDKCPVSVGHGRLSFRLN
jgi:type I restriction-modification system DNA methylase subunit